MNTFKHLKLGPHKGLKLATLIELGKINVLCGPNNSGKSTVLECIVGEKLRSIGKMFDAIVVDRVIHESHKNIGWQAPVYKDSFVQILEKLLKSESPFFVTDFNSIYSAFEVQWRAFHPRTQAPGTHFNQAFLVEFPSSPTTILIPAKRRLDSSTILESSPNIKPEGHGVLNYLFLAKNQDSDSDLQKSYEKISAGFRSITNGYDFDVLLKANNRVELVFRWPKSKWIHADDCGLGFRDLLTMLYFGIASEHEVILIEEPENHLHPEIQRRLIAYLRENTSKQFFLSTHSSVFLNTQYADRVFTCRMTDAVQVENATSRANTLTDLGYSIADNLVSDLVVLCEGPKDKPVLEEFFQKMGLVERSNIKVWPLGGDIMDQLDLSVFQESHKLIALVDNDPGSSAIRKRFQKKCEELKVPVTRLKRYAIENYFSIAAISAYMKGQMPAGISELAHDKPVAEQLGFEVKKNGGKIVREMKMEDLKGTDLEEFLNQVSKLATEESGKSGSGAN